MIYRREFIQTSRIKIYVRDYVTLEIVAMKMRLALVVALVAILVVCVLQDIMVRVWNMNPACVSILKQEFSFIVIIRGIACPKGTYNAGEVPGDLMVCRLCPDRNQKTKKFPATSIDDCICKNGFVPVGAKCVGNERISK